MSDSPGKATFTLLLGLLTVVIAAAAAATLFGSAQDPERPAQSARYLGLTPGEALELQLLAHKRSPAFEAGVDALEGPRGLLVLTHLLFALEGPDESRKLYVADTLGLRIVSPERDRLQSAYLEASRGGAPEAAQAELLDWTLARTPPAESPR